MKNKLWYLRKWTSSSEAAWNPSFFKTLTSGKLPTPPEPWRQGVDPTPFSIRVQCPGWLTHTWPMISPPQSPGLGLLWFHPLGGPFSTPEQGRCPMATTPPFRCPYGFANTFSTSAPPPVYRLQEDRKQLSLARILTATKPGARRDGATNRSSLHK